MAEKEPVRWITVKGKHLPVYEDGSIGIGQEDAPDSSLESKYKNINPNFKKDADMFDKEGYNNNCVKCALAFEANMRGADTQANPFKFGDSNDLDKSKSPNKAFGISRGDVWEVGRNKREMTVKEIELMMKEDWGEGSRAIIQIESAGIRHTMNVINDGGNVVIVDAQNGSHGTVANMLKGLPTKNVSLFRVDDKQISAEYADWAYKKRGN